MGGRGSARARRCGARTGGGTRTAHHRAVPAVGGDLASMPACPACRMPSGRSPAPIGPSIGWPKRVRWPRTCSFATPGPSPRGRCCSTSLIARVSRSRTACSWTCSTPPGDSVEEGDDERLPEIAAPAIVVARRRRRIACGGRAVRDDGHRRRPSSSRARRWRSRRVATGRGPRGTGACHVRNRGPV